MSYFHISKRKLQTQLNLWKTYLPRVQPFYAVKCNNDPVMMRWMKELYPTIGYDCASENEIISALPIVKPTEIVYAQPCKRASDIRVAQARGVTLTVADSAEEVEKLAEAKWEGGVLVRLLVDDGGSKQPFGSKFGAPICWLPKIYEVAKYHKLKLNGFSFHVGSECTQPVYYQKAIDSCFIGSKIAESYGFHTSIVDIGGGFLPNETSFIKSAEVINSALGAKFPEIDKCIAEPGRFFASPTHTLYTTVIGKKPMWDPSNPNKAGWRITIDESIYGSFSNIPFDKQEVVFELVNAKGNAETKDHPVFPTTIFGRTCDSGDTILRNVLMPELNVGDVLRINNMGAYTTVTASEFNGFPKTERIYQA